MHLSCSGRIQSMANEPKKLTEEEIKARKELVYEWKAKYKDGTELNEYDEEKQLVYHFGHIDQEKIYEFVLVPKRPHLYPVQINLETGMFLLDNKVFKELYNGKTSISLGLSLINKKIVSSWGNKAKLIFLRHVRRDFVPGPSGFGMNVEIIYELGWEAEVDDKHEKHVLLINEEGHLGIPPTPEQQGFKSL